MYVDSLVCVGVKGGGGGSTVCDSEVRHGYIMSPWLFNVYMDTMMKEVKIRMGRKGVRFLEEGRE